MCKGRDNLWRRPCLNCGQPLDPVTVSHVAAQALYKCKSCGMRFALQFQPWTSAFKALRLPAVRAASPRSAPWPYPKAEVDRE